MTDPLRRPRDQRGFTLLELLVALAVSALISLILFDGVGLATRGLDRLSARAEQVEARRSVEILMRRALGNVIALPIIDGEPGFTGHPTLLSFLSTIADGGAGLYRVELTVDDSAALILSRRVAGRSASKRGNESLLMRDVRHFAIDYFGATWPAVEPCWQHDWEGLATLPLLVRITLDRDGDGEQPAIILRLGNAG